MNADTLKTVTLLAAGALLGYWWAKRKPCGCEQASASTEPASASTESGVYEWLSGGWRA